VVERGREAEGQRDREASYVGSDIHCRQHRPQPLLAYSSGQRDGGGVQVQYCLFDLDSDIGFIVSTEQCVPICVLQSRHMPTY